MMEKFIEKKEKWTNKATDKPYVADSLIHDTTYLTWCLYQISKAKVKQFLRKLWRK